VIEPPVTQRAASNARVEASLFSSACCDIYSDGSNCGGPAINRHRRLVEMVGEIALLEP
jgi:hypothetical protein